jgi:hypothetical protein
MIKNEETDLEDFWKNCFKKSNIPLNHPKSKVIKRLAWEQGHSSGLDEVRNCFLDLAELIDNHTFD